MIKNSDSEHTKTLPISQTNENYTKKGYISVGTLIKANIPMRSPNNKSMDTKSIDTKSTDTYFEPRGSLENKTIKETLDPSHLLDDKTKTHHMTSIEDNQFISNGISVGSINSFNVGPDKEPSLKGKCKWRKLSLLAIGVLLVFTFIGAGVAIFLSSQNQGMELGKIS